jgi:iron complex transport system ATP-binding protein
MNPLAPLELASVALRAGGLGHTRELFSNLTLTVRAGERWVVLGPNGAGKSSLLAAMAGLFPLARGGVSLGGIALANWRGVALAAQRAWCPQFWSDPFPASVAQTLLLARRRDLWWTAHAALDADAEAVARRLDLGALLAQDVRALSGGERQRVAVATAVLQDAPLLLLDEPASHLDPAHQRLLVDLLLAHAQAQGAVVASLHDLNLAWDLSSHAVLIDGHGAAVAGTREEVMAPVRLSQAFGVAIDQVEVCGLRRFWTGPVRSARR